MASIMHQMERAAYFLFIAAVLLGNVATIVQTLLHRL
jgi:hypothetical protein